MDEAKKGKVKKFKTAKDLISFLTNKNRNAATSFSPQSNSDV
jgi:hypothetical protein